MILRVSFSIKSRNLYSSHFHADIMFLELIISIKNIAVIFLLTEIILE